MKRQEVLLKLIESVSICIPPTPIAYDNDQIEERFDAAWAERVMRASLYLEALLTAELVRKPE